MSPRLSPQHCHVKVVFENATSHRASANSAAAPTPSLTPTDLDLGRLSNPAPLVQLAWPRPFVSGKVTLSPFNNGLTLTCLVAALATLSDLSHRSPVVVAATALPHSSPWLPSFATRKFTFATGITPPRENLTPTQAGPTTDDDGATSTRRRCPQGRQQQDDIDNADDININNDDTRPATMDGLAIACAAIMKEMDIWYSLRSHFPLLDLSLPARLPEYLPTSPRSSPTSPHHSHQHLHAIFHKATSSLLPPCHVSLWLPPPSFATREFSFTTPLCESSIPTSCRSDAQDHHDTIPVVTWRAGGSGSPPPMTRQFQHDDDDGRKDDASKMMVTISTTPTTPTPTTSAGGSGSPPPTRRRRPPQGQRQQDGGDNIDNADDTNTDDNESMTRGPRLRWTSMIEGHFTGWKGGGICVDMPEMDKIIASHEEDSDLVCQPGVGKRSAVLSRTLDPGPTATIGGMLSSGCCGTNASPFCQWDARGLNSRRTVVLPSGEVIKTRRPSRKSSAGFDTTKLFVGAEGTLGILTEVTIRLALIVPITVATARFPDVRKASEAVIEIQNTGIGIQYIKLVDAFIRVAMATENSAREYDIADHLFFKLRRAMPGALAGAVDVSEEAAATWTDRKNAHYSAWSTDVCVPISNLPRLVYETQDIERSRIMCFVLGHAGDGNFHTLAFKTDEELKTARGLVHRMVKRALALGGTCTGEHGVGIGKKVEELGTGTVALMKTIKRAIDPLGIMDPEKLYQDDDTTPDS
ncbi:hypothetical protein EDB83DRAFT_2681164 [Lactarius deliciosus]|nr:hypothetical protein EDB83DRAFT_2681164 [Lactarius deliciosus]